MQILLAAVDKEIEQSKRRKFGVLIFSLCLSVWTYALQKSEQLKLVTAREQAEAHEWGRGRGGGGGVGVNQRDEKAKDKIEKECMRVGGKVGVGPKIALEKKLTSNSKLDAPRSVLVRYQPIRDFTLTSFISAFSSTANKFGTSPVFNKLSTSSRNDSSFICVSVRRNTVGFIWQPALFSNVCQLKREGRKLAQLLYLPLTSTNELVLSLLSATVQ